MVLMKSHPDNYHWRFPPELLPSWNFYQIVLSWNSSPLDKYHEQYPQWNFPHDKCPMDFWPQDIFFWTITPRTNTSRTTAPHENLPRSVPMTLCPGQLSMNNIPLNNYPPSNCPHEAPSSAIVFLNLVLRQVPLDNPPRQLPSWNSSKENILQDFFP